MWSETDRAYPLYQFDIGAICLYNNPYGALLIVGVLCSPTKYAPSVVVVGCLRSIGGVYESMYISKHYLVKDDG